MAYTSKNARRLLAAFLCLILVLTLGLLALAWVVSPVTVQAQAVLSVQPLGCEVAAPAPGEGERDLSPEETATYIAITSEGTRAVSANVTIRITETQSGGATIKLIYDGRICAYDARVGPVYHSRGLAALDGSPL